MAEDGDVGGRGHSVSQQPWEWAPPHTCPCREPPWSPCCAVGARRWGTVYVVGASAVAAWALGGRGRWASFQFPTAPTAQEGRPGPGLPPAASPGHSLGAASPGGALVGVFPSPLLSLGEGIFTPAGGVGHPWRESWALGLAFLTPCPPQEGSGVCS